MTELQPSPAGYRGQDEPGGPARSPSSAPLFQYKNHQHLVGETLTTTTTTTTTNHYKNSNTISYSSSSSENYNNKQTLLSSSPRGVQQQQQSSDFYHIEKNETTNIIRNSSDVVVNKKSSICTGYNEGYKKNTPGYKNDSGYSESSGFGSYSLPLSERDEASPPPTPPVRDASSLKGVCYGPGHEKYPSWPSAPEHHNPEEDIHPGTSSHGGSHRSKSWTDHTSYPKEKPAQYTRPHHTKRPNPAFTQQLKTVMERCEKIPAETYEARNRNNSNNESTEPRLWPRVDREGKSLGDVEYVAPSPPEREQQPPQTLSHADLEAYVRSYQDPQVGQVDLYQESTTLTQAGLEEYARVQHSQQASYAQSEGYHSYVSSVDSTTNTPFLDRLRRDSEAVAQRPTSSWDDAREGRDSVVTTSSGSASSSETLKWHGSMSDVSVASGLPVRQNVPEKWHHGSMSDVSSMSGGVGVQKQLNSEENNVKWQGSLSDVSSSGISGINKRQQQQLNGSGDKWKQDKWQSSMNDRNKRGAVRGAGGIVSQNTELCTPTPIVVVGRERNWQESSIDDEENHHHHQQHHSQLKKIWPESTRNSEHQNEKYAASHPHQPMPQSPTHQQQQQQHASLNSPQSPDNWNTHHGSMSDLSTNGLQNSKQLIAHSARVQTPQRHHSESVLYLDRERSQRKLYPGGGNGSPAQDVLVGQSSRMPAISPQQTQLSVAERISELEKQQQQQMRYTYLDPDKRHRVSDPTLKAIQKKALLSFYERHHQSSWRSEPQLAQGTTTPAPQSPPPQPPPRPRPPSSSRRASSASDYASGGAWREKSTRNPNTADLPSPKHQHSNSCGSLSTDLLGPVIVGPAISIDDWVPERPPKKPHLRNAYNDRVPSPDLPPPSPPTVTEHEVLNCDDPLPPPPMDLQNDNSNDVIGGKDNLLDRHNKSQQPERQSTRRSSSKHTHNSKIRDQQLHDINKLCSSPDKNHHFVRASSGQKHVDSGIVIENGVSAGFATHRMVATGRSSLRYPATQKLMVNGRVAAPTRRISEERLVFPARPPAQLPDLISQRYSDSGNQRPAPQVPVEPRIIRQESMRVESTRIDASGLLRNDSQRLESSTGQRPQPQVPKNDIKNPAQPQRPNYLPLIQDKNSKYPENGHNFTLSSPIKTSYEASSKLFAEGSPQKYHEPPKYVPNSQRLGDNNGQRNYYALPPPKYSETQKPQPQTPVDRYGSGSPSSPPPPLAPRQNSSGRKSLPPPPRPAPPHGQQGSQSKASYLAHRRERGAPDSEGSYKRTMSPTARLDDWPPLRDHDDDPILLRVTPRHQQHSIHHSELPKSHSVDALHNRLNERSSTTTHSVEVIGKLSYDLSKKLQATDVRTGVNNIRNENNNINNNNNNNNNNIHIDNSTQLTTTTIVEIEQQQQQQRSNKQDRISPQSIEVLNDRNRQLERERRKLAANCEPASSSSSMTTMTTKVLSNPNLQQQIKSGDNYNRERTAVIEMTSRNVELLNRRNAVIEKRDEQQQQQEGGIKGFGELNTENRAPPIIEKPPPPTSSPPRSPDVVEKRRGGAVPRRTGSCSSASSSSLKSLDVRNASSSNTLPNRCSPNKIKNDKNSSIIESQINKIESSSTSSSSLSLNSPTIKSVGTDSNFGNFVERINISTRRKISSPTQTDETQGSSSYYYDNNYSIDNNDSINNYTKSSQTSITNNNNNNNNNINNNNNDNNNFLDPIRLSGSSSPVTSSPTLNNNNNSNSNDNNSSNNNNNNNNSSVQCSPSSSPTSGGIINLKKRKTSGSISKSGNNSPCVSPQPGIEGLTLVQRTEIVLRVNAATSDAASQTEIITTTTTDNDEELIIKNSDDDYDDKIVATSPEPRKKLPEEIECEELSRDLASQLSPNDKLLPILVPVPEHKRPTDYVTGLFRVEATLQPRQRRRLSLSMQQDETSANITALTKTEDNKIETSSSTISSTDLSSVMNDSTIPLSPTSAYFTTSEGKARFLTRYSRDVNGEIISGNLINNDNDDDNDDDDDNNKNLSSSVPAVVASTNNLDLKQKKEELVIRLDKKLVVLRAEQEAVREEGEINEALGAKVTSRIVSVARPAEASKYRLHVEEVGKITSLLLGLSGRLARAENALYGMSADHAERKILESKRDKLLDQLEEAKVLKSNIDKRSINVSAILLKYLNEDEYTDYQHFINMKAKLIMDGREIQDKVKLGEEQLTALKEAID